MLNSINRINYDVLGMSSTPQPGMTKWAWLGSGNGAGVWVPKPEDNRVRVNGTLSTADAASGKYEHDSFGWYIKSGYKEPARMKIPTPTLVPTPSPIDSVARNTGLGKASMLPSRLGGYNFMRKM